MDPRGDDATPDDEPGGDDDLDADASLDEPDGPDDLDDDGPADEDHDSDGEGTPPRPRSGGLRQGLDARLLVICVLIALIAALVAGLVTRSVLDDDEAADGPNGRLTEVVAVPDSRLVRLGSDDEVALTDFRGQALVVNFWGSWCGPCVKEMPDLEAVQTSLGDDVTFIGVNVRDDVDKALELAEETGVTYELLRDVDGELIRDLGITTFPTTLLVLPDGTIVDTIYTKVEVDQLCDKINQSLMAGALTECG